MKKKFINLKNAEKLDMVVYDYSYNRTHAQAHLYKLADQHWLYCVCWGSGEYAFPLTEAQVAEWYDHQESELLTFVYYEEVYPPDGRPQEEDVFFSVAALPD